LGGAASPPGEARGAVPEVVHEFASLTAPLGPAFAGPVPPNGLRPRGDRQVEDPQGFSPQERSDIGGSSLAARRGEGGRPGSGPRVRFAHSPPRPGIRRAGPPKRPPAEGGQTSGRPPGFLPPGAKRHWGEQPRRQARRGGPSRKWSTSSLRSQPPSARHSPGRSPQTASGRGGTDKWKTPRVSPPRSEATLGGAASPPGEARGAVPEVVHEFASLTAPLGPAFAGPVPPNGLRPRGDRQVEDPQGFSPQERSDIGGSSLATRRGEGGRPGSGPRVRFAHSPPPNGLRPRGDRHVEDPQGFSPQERSDIGGSSLAARRGEGGRPRREDQLLIQIWPSAAGMRSRRVANSRTTSTAMNGVICGS
jgi:hypothetical protein